MRGRRQTIAIRRRRSGSLNPAGEAAEEWDNIVSDLGVHIQPVGIGKAVWQNRAGQVMTSSHYIVLPVETDIEPDDRIEDGSDNNYVVQRLEKWRTQIEAYASLTNIE